MVVRVDADPRLPRQPTLIGVQCFDVPLAADASVLLVHLRDVGLILPPEQAEAGGPQDDGWETEREAERAGGAEGVNGGVRRTTSALDATLDYGGDRLRGPFDLVLEGEFGSGVSASSELPAIEGLPEGTELPPNEVARFEGSADGFSRIARDVTLSGVVTVTNEAGTDIELGRLFARPRDLPRSCDVPIALADGEQREVRLDVPSSDGGPSIERPGLTVTVVEVSGEAGERVARVAVGSYLSEQGLPRYVLVDWTEQFTGELAIEGCDGATYVEEGAVPDGSDRTVGDEEIEAALGEAGRSD